MKKSQQKHSGIRLKDVKYQNYETRHKTNALASAKKQQRLDEENETRKFKQIFEKNQRKLLNINIMITERKTQW